MADFPGYQIVVRRQGEVNDVTNYTQGFSTTADFTFNRPARFRTTMTLTNSTGEFTPSEGGGTGTFKDVLWFESYLQIDVYSTGTTVFEGLISDFDIVDNGVESTVTIKAVDWMTATRSDVFDVAESSNIYYDNPASQMYYFFNGSSGYGSGAETPKFGYTNATYLFDQADDVFLEMGRPASSNVTVMDAVTQMFIAPLPCVVLPNEIVRASSTDIVFRADVLGRSITYADTTEFVFTENPTGDELPFQTVTPNFDRNMITSNTSYESGMAGVGTATASNGATKQKYGQRNRRFTGTGHLQGNDTTEEYGMLKSAEFWTTRQAEARYVPRRLTTSIGTVKAYNDSTAAFDQLEQLLSAKYGMWHPVQITYTPTGGSQTTADCVISGRTINATPKQTTIILDLLPAVDYQSFRLDSPIIGVLAGIANVTTYDDSGVTYDDVAEPYDGSGTTIEGFRLG